jgi:hypothetical protein
MGTNAESNPTANTGNTRATLPEAKWFTYSQAREWQRTQALRQSDVPIEHAISLPIPTRRWPNPGYVQFAAPSVRSPDHPTIQGAPDRWWAFDARGGRLIFYALTTATPMQDKSAKPFTQVEVQPTASTVAGIREQLGALATGMDAVLRDFFDGKSGDKGARAQVRALLAAVIPAALMPQYRALAPDFFGWLES